MSLGTLHEREKLYAFAVDFLKSKRAEAVLDVACDYGLGTKILSEGVTGVITGLDIEGEAITAANATYSAANIKFLRGDARHMEFPDGTFDAIVSFHTIEHITPQEQAAFVRELARVMKPGAPLLIATPDHEVWKLQGIANMQDGHVGELTRHELEDVLTRNGFRVVQTYGQFMLKSTETFYARRLLNVLKKLDVLKLRRLLGKKVIDNVDIQTQPVSLNDDVVSLGINDKASVNVIVCGKA